MTKGESVDKKKKRMKMKQWLNMGKKKKKGGRGTGKVVRGWRESENLGFKRKGMINSITCC